MDMDNKYEYSYDKYKLQKCSTGNNNIFNCVHI